MKALYSDQRPFRYRCVDEPGTVTSASPKFEHRARGSSRKGVIKHLEPTDSMH